jgi:hypothetical protein
VLGAADGSGRAKERVKARGAYLPPLTPVNGIERAYCRSNSGAISRYRGDQHVVAARICIIADRSSRGKPFIGLFGRTACEAFYGKGVRLISGSYTSRHFAALQNLVDYGSITDIG